MNSGTHKSGAGIKELQGLREDLYDLQQEMEGERNRGKDFGKLRSAVINLQSAMAELISLDMYDEMRGAGEGGSGEENVSAGKNEGLSRGSLYRQRYYGRY